MVEGILVEGLIYGIMSLGVFISFRVLNFPDLSVDGTFPLGAVIMASSLLAGIPAPIAFLLSFCGGAAGGAATAIIHTQVKVPPLLSGILVMTMLWSVNIRVLGGKANLSLLRIPTSIRLLQERFINLPPEVVTLIFCAVLALFVMVILDLFFHTDIGLATGAMGSNEQMIITQGTNPTRLKLLGLMLSNGVVGFAGAISAQYLGFADVNLGQGIIIAGLASVMIGEFVLRSTRIELVIFRVVLGSLVFRGIMYAGRYYGYYIRLTPNDLRLIAGLLIITVIVINRLRGGMVHARHRRKLRS